MVDGGIPEGIPEQEKQRSKTHIQSTSTLALIDLFSGTLLGAFTNSIEASPHVVTCLLRIRCIYIYI